MILFLPFFWGGRLLKYSWFTMCVSGQSDSVVCVYIHAHIYSFSDFSPL